MPVSDSHPLYLARLPVWQKCRDVAAGQEAVQGCGPLYLPRLQGQSDQDYDAYKARALFFNATQRTLDGMMGLIFRKSPRIELPAAAAALSADIDLAGNGLNDLLESLVEELLVVGRAGLLVDHPPADPGLVTAGQARAAGQRPFLSLYRAEDIIDWRLGAVGSATRPTQVRLMETLRQVDPGDEFQRLSIPQIRVLDLDEEGLYQQRLFRHDGNDWHQAGPTLRPLIDGERLDFLPFTFFGTKGAAIDPAKPPLLDLVNVNLSHYRTAADFEHGAHFTGLPTPVVTGHRLEQGEGLTIGAGEAWVLPSPDAKAQYLEFSGQGLEALMRSLEMKEAQMAAIGARMLAPEKRAAEAAETLAIRRGGENSVLAALARSLSEGLSESLTLFGRWAGAVEPARVSLNRDYLPIGMTAEQLKAHVAAWQAGALSEESLFEALRQGEVLPEALTFEEEQARKSGVTPSGLL